MDEHETNEDDIIQLKCPVCSESNFEPIYVAGKTILRWEKQGKLAFRWNMNKIETYRCLHCDYILMFGRLPK
jgi:hypothetical protein